MGMRSLKRRLHFRPRSLCLISFLVISFCCISAAQTARTTLTPQIVEYRFKDFSCLLDKNSELLKQQIQLLAQQLNQAAHEYQHRVIALRLRNLPLDFNELQSVNRTIVRSACNHDQTPTVIYEMAVSHFITQALQAAGPSLRDRFGVIGLPFEAYGRSSSAAHFSNLNYKETLSQIDTLLPARSFILSDTTATLATIQTGVPISLADTKSRKVLVRVNDLWILVEPYLPPPPVSVSSSQETGTSSNGITWTVYNGPPPAPNPTPIPERAPQTIDASPEPSVAAATVPDFEFPLTDPNKVPPDPAPVNATIYDETGLWNDSATENDLPLDDIGLEEAELSAHSLEDFKSAWISNDLAYDLNSDGLINNTDLQILTDTISQPVSTTHKRLLHFQTVGFSSLSEFGFVSRSTCTPEAGWNAHIASRLQPLVDYLGNDAFDWWGHNTGGVWEQRPFKLTDRSSPTIMLYEQLFIARYRYPELVNYQPLQTFAANHGINLYGYIGYPLCDSENNNLGQALGFEAQPQHGDTRQFLNWYREFVEFGFSGVGHDATGLLSHDSAWLSQIKPILQDLNMEVFIEANPKRHDGAHLLGLSVVAEHRVWKAREELLNGDGEISFYTEEEIREAGGRAIYLVTWPEGGGQGEIATAPGFNIFEWRFKTAKKLLRNGHTVAVHLHSLMTNGYDIKKLVELSRDTAHVAHSNN